MHPTHSRSGHAQEWVYNGAWRMQPLHVVKCSTLKGVSWAVWAGGVQDREQSTSRSVSKAHKPPRSEVKLGSLNLAQSIPLCCLKPV